MDPSRNLALYNVKLQLILQQATPRSGSPPAQEESERDMPPPPAYHTLVDPTDSDPLPSMHDGLEDEDGKDEDVPEININATTQIRGHGNIISIAQMDSMRIANLLAILIHGGVPPQGDAQAQGQQQAQSQPQAQPRRQMPKININVHCGATVVGDRNIVGPGLGDIARHMQIAQQRQQQQQQEQQQNQTSGDARTVQQQQQQQRPAPGFPVPVQAPLLTPPMSRSSSLGSDSSVGIKRKAEGELETPVKRAR
ncbi:hypothetical protein BU23DRAFT_575336 [Bimuria novae-zelandiae CBS 107.79]|uniref:Uncharacterized protein n=1 Tax=Bimuria novae-zelandiae CBS 107.79 TaxID=1447943 RepID=A0A6A5UJ88_9PLEO|nr:hypothetical protein BU23DRAFT_575336 [Bimuria novae-zelandiae CBS 107.79]